MRTYSWPDPKGQRKLNTVGDCIFWSYSALSISRETISRIRSGETDPFPRGRTVATAYLMERYLDGRKKISNMDRDDRLAQSGLRTCAHCGSQAPKYHWDHLIPTNRLQGGFIPLNQVLSCPTCNLARGKKDLLQWHRERQTFPTLAILRRYLKLCYTSAIQHHWMDLPKAEAAPAGLPFDPLAMPRKLPAIEDLIWDHSHPDFWPRSETQ